MLEKIWGFDRDNQCEIFLCGVGGLHVIRLIQVKERNMHKKWLMIFISIFKCGEIEHT